MGVDGGLRSTVHVECREANVDPNALLAYFLAVVALTAAPGPIMAVLVARSISRDASGAATFAGGLIFGDIVAVCAVALGVGVWAQSMPEWVALAKYAGVAYLLWLSIKIWKDVSGARPGQGRHSGSLATFTAGTALCLGNPSTILIYMLLLPGVAPNGFNGAGQLTIVVATTFLAVALVFLSSILLATRLNRVMSSPSSSTMFGRIAAASIGVTSLWILVA